MSNTLTGNHLWTNLWEHRSHHKTKCSVCDEKTHQMSWEVSSGPDKGVYFQCENCAAEFPRWKTPVYIFKDGNKYKALIQTPQGLEPIEESDDLFGMTSLVKQAGNSYYIVYKQPDGHHGSPIPAKEKKELRNWVHECSVKDYVGW